MAHGRVQTPAANQPPVLTGMPVSGMAYLDRPNEAGYFLFPDLSVRHEGRYRLTFNLYEETKEDKDKDPDSPDFHVVAPGFVNATGGSFDFRMEVKSRDFVVFSAKKFPGLTESTALSRTVAEQGCRVRIRRDVRMRRRDGGKGGDYDKEDEYARQRRTATPEVKSSYRARSTSGSVERTPSANEYQRRTSGAEYPPQFPQTPASAGGHLQFLGSAPQYHPHAQSHPKPPSMPPSPSYQTSHGAQFPSVHQSPHQHMQQQQQQNNVHAQAPGQQQPMIHPAYPPPPQQPTYMQAERSQPQAYAHSNPSPHREVAPREYREPAAPQYSDAPPRAEYALSGPPSHQLYRQPSKEFILPPPTLKPMTYPPPPPRANTPLTLPPISDFAKHLAPRAMAPLTSPTSDRVPQLQAMPPPKPTAHLPPPLSVAGSKRTRDDPSRYDLDTPRYHNGAREDPQMLDENGEPQLIYRRANGHEIQVPNDYSL